MSQPELPEGIEWPVQTKAWWNALPSIPGSDSWLDADWQYLLDTALIHADIWGSGNFDRLPELSSRLKSFGVTPDARRQIAQAEVKVEHRVTVLEEIAERRRGKSNGGSQRRSRA
jgi:hypothetical protein